MKDAPPDTNTGSAQQASVLVVILLGAFALGNAFFSSLADNYLGNDSIWDRVYLVLAGAVSAQVGLHTIWTVFSNGKLLRRIILSGVAAAVLLLSLFGPQILNPGIPGGEWRMMVPALLHLPALALGLQAPLWIFKGQLGWRVCGRDLTTAEQRRRSLSIRGLFQTTAVVAICLACLRLACTLADVPPTPYFLYVFINACAVFVVSLVILIPNLLGILWAKRVWLGMGITIALESLLVIVLMLITFMGYGVPPIEVFFYAGLFLFGFIVTLNVPLVVARRLGYRLRLRRAKQLVTSSPFGDEQEPANESPGSPDETDEQD